MKTALWCFACISLLCSSCKSQSVEQKPKVESVTGASGDVVSEIRVAGNRRIATETIKAQIQTKSGDLFSERTIKGDIERLRGLGEFDDVRIQDDASSTGSHILTFQVYEKLPSHR